MKKYVSIFFVLFVLFVFVRSNLDEGPTLSILSPAFKQASHLTNIRPGLRAFDVRNSSTIKFKCTGNQPIVWQFSSIHGYDQALLDTYAEISNTCEYGTNCESILTLEYATYEDTGMYSCHYNSSIESDSLIMDSEYEKNDPDSESTIKLKQYVYVFVNTDENILLPSATTHVTLILHFIQGHPATIPCIPTDSRANVSLWKSVPKEEQIIVSEKTTGISYDPTLGFHFEVGNWGAAMSSFTCRASLPDGRTDQLIIVVNWSVEPESLQPTISYEESDPSSGGGNNYNFTLTCSVRSELGVWTLLSWKYPDKSYINPDITLDKLVIEEDRKRRYQNITNIKPIKDGAGGAYQSIKLTIINATLGDSGNYTCVAKTVGNKIFTTSYSVQLNDLSADSSVEFETDFYKTPNDPLRVNVGTKVKFVVNIKGYRPLSGSTTSDLYWIKDDVIIAKVLKVSNSKLLGNDPLSVRKSSLNSGNEISIFGANENTNSDDSGSTAADYYYTNWFKDHYKSKLIKNQIILEIDASSMKDNGNYTLVYNNTASKPHSSSISVFLHVLGLPLVEVFDEETESDSKFYFYPESKHILTCNIFSDPSINMWFKWLSCCNRTIFECIKMSQNFNHMFWKDIEDSNRDNDAKVNGSSEYLSLHLEVTAKVTGFYACFGKNNNGTSVNVQPFNVTRAENGLQVSIEPESKDDTVEGRQILITCRVSKFKFFPKIPTFLEWNFEQNYGEYHNFSENINYENISTINLTKNINFGENFYNLNNEKIRSEFGLKIDTFVENEFTLVNQLIIRNANLSIHSGNYSCRILSQNREEIGIVSKILNVSKSEAAVIEETNLVQTPMLMKATSKLQLFCNVRGKPKPVVKWIKDGVLVKNDSAGIEFHDAGQTLVISRLAASDSGMYSCVVMLPNYPMVSHSTDTSGHDQSFQSDESFKDPTQILASREMFVQVDSDENSNRLGSTSVITLTIVFVTIGIVFVIMAIFMGKRIRNERIQKQELQFFSAALFDSGQLDLFNPDLPLDEQVDLLPYDTRWEIPREKLKLGKTLGQGAFGRVVKAQAYGLNHNYWDDAPINSLGVSNSQGVLGVSREEEEEEDVTIVAVKMLKERASSEQMKSLMAELKILIHLGRHLNIVNLLAACTSGITRGELFVVVEFCPFGNLRHFLLGHRNQFVDQIDPDSGFIDNTIQTRVKVFSLTDSITTEGADSYGNNDSNDSHKVALFAANPNYNTTGAICESTVKYAKIAHGGKNNNILSARDNCANGSDDSSMIVMNSFDCSSVQGSSSYNHEYVNTNTILPDADAGKNRKVSKKSDAEERPVTTCDLIAYSFQVARGMEYLASRKLIHRDLAARNVLLTEENIVKICDFGLAKDCYKYDEYVKKNDGPLPVKWMAIESIRDKVFNTKSDVWSFGILLWEFFTLGSTPYPGMEVDEDFYLKLTNGYRMEKPKYCPNFIFKDIMSKCWLKEPNLRPDFGQLSSNLGDLLEASVRQHYLDLNDPYQEMNSILFSNNDYLNMKSADLELESADQEFQSADQRSENYVPMKTTPNIDDRNSTPIECDLILSASAGGGVKNPVYESSFGKMGGVYQRGGGGGVCDGPMIQLDSFPDLSRCSLDTKRWGDM